MQALGGTFNNGDLNFNLEMKTRSCDVRVKIIDYYIVYIIIYIIMYCLPEHFYYTFVLTIMHGTSLSNRRGCNGWDTAKILKSYVW